MTETSITRGAVTLVLALALAFAPPPVPAGTCTVPGSHATIAQAVADVGCSTIQLAAQGYDESVRLDRTLTLAGPGGGGAVLAGGLEARGAGVVATVVALQVQNGCVPEGAVALDGAELVGDGLEVLRSEGASCPETPIFLDGFESGDTSRWS